MGRRIVNSEGTIGRLFAVVDGVGIGGRLGLGLEASESVSTAIEGGGVERGGGLEVKTGSKMPSEGISGAGELAMRASFGALNSRREYRPEENVSPKGYTNYDLCCEVIVEIRQSRKKMSAATCLLFND